MLGQRRRRWTTIGPALGWCIVFAWIEKEWYVLHVMGLNMMRLPLWKMISHTSQVLYIYMPWTCQVMDVIYFNQSSFEGWQVFENILRCTDDGCWFRACGPKRKHTRDVLANLWGTFGEASMMFRQIFGDASGKILGLIGVTSVNSERYIFRIGDGLSSFDVRQTNIGDASGAYWWNLDNAVVMAMYWRRQWSALWVENIFKVERFYIEPHTLWLPKSWIKKKSYLFCWRVTGWRYKIEHTGGNIAIASSMLRRAVCEHQRCITQIIRDIITSNIHPPCLHEHVENIADVSPMCLGHFEPWCTSLNFHRLWCATRQCSAIYRRWFLATKHREKISMTFFSMSRCLGEAWRLLAYVADHSPKYWRCPNLEGSSHCWFPLHNSIISNTARQRETVVTVILKSE